MAQRAFYLLGQALRETGLALDKVGMRMQGNYAYRDQLSRHRRIAQLGGVKPVVGDNTFVAPSAAIIGDVTVGEQSSVWYGAVLRGDVNAVTIGDRSSIGDRCVVHVSKNQPTGLVAPTVIGSDVVVEDGAILHACTLEDASLVQMGAIVSDGAVVGTRAVVGAGAVVTPGKHIPSGELWAGNPAVFVRALSPAEKDSIAESAAAHVALAAEHSVEHAKTPQQHDYDANRHHFEGEQHPEKVQTY